MRKLLLLCVVLFSGVVAQAQIQKGDVQLGGSITYNSNESGGQDNSNFTFSPQAGLFVSETTSIGVLLGFNSTTFNAFNQNNGNLVELTNSLFSFGAYARFHKSVADNFYLFLQPAVALGTGKVEQINANDVDTNTFLVGVSPGMTYFLSPKFALELRLGGVNYSRFKTDNNGTENTSTAFSFDMDLASVGLGLNFYIR